MTTSTRKSFLADLANLAASFRARIEAGQHGVDGHNVTVKPLFGAAGGLVAGPVDKIAARWPECVD